MAWNDAPPVWAAMALWGVATWRFARASMQAWLAFALALVLFISPLCAMSAALFSVRVLHHLLLVAVIAPLLAMAAHRLHPSARIPQAITATLALLVFTAVLWLWHVPQAYHYGLTTVSGYWLMQASLLGSAVAFWWLALHPKLDWTASVGVLFASVAQMGLLGALIVFSTQLLYPLHALPAAAWSIEAMRDQQLGGLLMWVPAIGPFLLAGLWRLQRALREPAAP